MAGRSDAACIVNPMATWGDRGQYEGIDDDTIGERGTESHKALHYGVSFVIVKKRKRRMSPKSVSGTREAT